MKKLLSMKTLFIVGIIPVPFVALHGNGRAFRVRDDRARHRTFFHLHTAAQEFADHLVERGAVFFGVRPALVEQIVRYAKRYIFHGTHIMCTKIQNVGIGKKDAAATDRTDQRELMTEGNNSGSSRTCS